MSATTSRPSPGFEECGRPLGVPDLIGIAIGLFAAGGLSSVVEPPSEPSRFSAAGAQVEGLIETILLGANIAGPLAVAMHCLCGRWIGVRGLGEWLWILQPSLFAAAGALARALPGSGLEVLGLLFAAQAGVFLLAAFAMVRLIWHCPLRSAFATRAFWGAAVAGAAAAYFMANLLLYPVVI